MTTFNFNFTVSEERARDERNRTHTAAANNKDQREIEPTSKEQKRNGTVGGLCVFVRVSVAEQNQKDIIEIEKRTIQFIPTQQGLSTLHAHPKDIYRWVVYTKSDIKIGIFFIIIIIKTIHNLKSFFKYFRVFLFLALRCRVLLTIFMLSRLIFAAVEGNHLN